MRTRRRASRRAGTSARTRAGTPPSATGSASRECPNNSPATAEIPAPSCPLPCALCPVPCAFALCLALPAKQYAADRKPRADRREQHEVPFLESSGADGVVQRERNRRRRRVAE